MKKLLFLLVCALCLPGRMVGAKGGSRRSRAQAPAAAPEAKTKHWEAVTPAVAPVPAAPETVAPAPAVTPPPSASSGGPSTSSSGGEASSAAAPTPAAAAEKSPELTAYDKALAALEELPLERASYDELEKANDAVSTAFTSIRVSQVTPQKILTADLNNPHRAVMKKFKDLKSHARVVALERFKALNSTETPSEANIDEFNLTMRNARKYFTVKTNELKKLGISERLGFVEERLTRLGQIEETFAKKLSAKRAAASSSSAAPRPEVAKAAAPSSASAGGPVPASAVDDEFTALVQMMEKDIAQGRRALDGAARNPEEDKKLANTLAENRSSYLNRVLDGTFTKEQKSRALALIETLREMFFDLHTSKKVSRGLREEKTPSSAAASSASSGGGPAKAPSAAVSALSSLSSSSSVSSSSAARAAERTASSLYLNESAKAATSVSQSFEKSTRSAGASFVRPSSASSGGPSASSAAEAPAAPSPAKLGSARDEKDILLAAVTKFENTKDLNEANLLINTLELLWNLTPEQELRVEALIKTFKETAARLRSEAARLGRSVVAPSPAKLKSGREVKDDLLTMLTELENTKDLDEAKRVINTLELLSNLTPEQESRVEALIKTFKETVARLRSEAASSASASSAPSSSASAGRATGAAVAPAAPSSAAPMPTAPTAADAASSSSSSSAAPAAETGKAEIDRLCIAYQAAVDECLKLDVTTSSLESLSEALAKYHLTYDPLLTIFFNKSTLDSYVKACIQKDKKKNDSLQKWLALTEEKVKKIPAAPAPAVVAPEASSASSGGGSMPSAVASSSSSASSGGESFAEINEFLASVEDSIEMFQKALSKHENLEENLKNLKTTMTGLYNKHMSTEEQKREMDQLISTLGTLQTAFEKLIATETPAASSSSSASSGGPKAPVSATKDTARLRTAAIRLGDTFVNTEILKFMPSDKEIEAASLATLTEMTPTIWQKNAVINFKEQFEKMAAAQKLTLSDAQDLYDLFIYRRILPKISAASNKRADRIKELRKVGEK